MTKQIFYGAIKKILHGLIKDGDSFRNNKILDKQFNNFRKKYWKWRLNSLEWGD
ncbi:HNH/ENDO VII family nuclease [Virgibacillus sp. FSP13]